MKILKYSELIEFDTFEERFDYLKLGGSVGEETFGSYRYLNQRLYSSREWRSLRDEIILRDNGCDLGIPDREIHGKILIHHLNPVSRDDIVHADRSVLDPENLVCVSYDTHQAIHYGDMSLLLSLPKERTPNDTCPWKG